MSGWLSSKLFWRGVIKSELMHRQEQQWSRLGAEAPYWSVLSGCSKTADIALADKREFYRSGEDEILLLRDFFRYAGRVVPSGVCVDWGCGLGRVTIHLTSLFQQVIGVDISGPHLDLAREYISSLDSQVGQKILLYHVLENQNALAKLQGKVDFVHSILVLQHVPPPLMITTLTTFARLLKKGGYAFFQIPTYGENYNYPHYDLEHAGEFDMHALAQHEIHTIFRRHGCSAVATIEKDRTGPLFHSHYFIFQKDA